IIEEGYRKARKYHGSFTVVIQSDLDMLKFGGVGKVIYGNSEFKFKLESPDYEQARKEGILDYDDFTMRVLKSVKSNKPKYSEIFIDSKTLGMGVVRLCVDSYSYFVYTSEAKEYMEIERIVEQKGVSYAEAIEEMVSRVNS
ncbi:MAG: conjugal transfer protein TraC, partial [Nitrospirae bacterium]